VSYKTIIVHLDAGKFRRQRLDVALSLADRFDAHLIGLFGLEAIEPVPAAAAVWPQVMLELHKHRRAAAESAAQEFRDATRKAQYTAKSEWRATLGDGLAALRFHAKYADLIVAGQPGRDDQGVPASFAEQLVLSIGRPVLYVPAIASIEDCGRRVLVAWNASREAARAVRDALPLLQTAQVTEAVTFDPKKVFHGDDALPDPDLGAYLSRHGAKATVSAVPTGDIDVGSAILSRAADNASDLIVMGAYGHTRVKELVFGGATRTLFESMTVPTLMSH
jgi:nucleotide-binding universal stress UspA family protein